MALEARLDKIPNFLKARTPQGLRRLMFRNNASRSTQFVYHSIQFVDGYWFAWFYETTTAAEVAIDGDRSAETL